MAKPPRMAWLGHANLPKPNKKEKVNRRIWQIKNNNKN